MDLTTKGIKGSLKHSRYLIMNFTILFQFVGSLNFHVVFFLNSYSIQDMFFFEGGNSSAHLYRNNNTVSLYVRNNRSFEIYQTEILNQLNFSWRGYKVNGTDMKRIKSSGSTENMNDLNEFTFLSPILDLQPDVLNEICNLNSEKPMVRGMSVSSLNLKNVNYGYIAGIILIFAFAIEMKMKIPLLIDRLFRKDTENEADDSDYESMVNMEIEV